MEVGAPGVAEQWPGATVGRREARAWWRRPSMEEMTRRGATGREEAVVRERPGTHRLGCEGCEGWLTGRKWPVAIVRWHCYVLSQLDQSKQ